MGFMAKIIATLHAPSVEPTTDVTRITKTNIKCLFREIRKGKLNTVKRFVVANKGYVNVRATAPPKKDDGQSPLQVSLKTANFDIAVYLIEQGADVNFMEESNLNAWRTPVLHDAIRATAFCVGGGVGFEKPLHIVEMMLQRGANPNSVDSYGNSCLIRAILDARIRIRPQEVEVARKSGWLRDFEALFRVLIQAGADIHAKCADQPSPFEETRGSFLEQFIA